VASNHRGPCCVLIVMSSDTEVTSPPDPAPPPGPSSGSGSVAAYGVVYRDHVGRLLQLAVLLCGNRQRAEDAVAETFAKVFPHWQRGRVTEPGSYLRRALVNEINSGGRRRLLEVREERRRSAAGRGRSEVDEQAVDRDAVMRALRELSPGHRTVLVLRYFEDLSEPEIAALLGLALGTVKSQTSRGLARLRALMEEK
jgi:RNA polymerase sigma-70 factor (sigma-E family)